VSRVGIVATWLAAGLLTLGLMALAKDLMRKTPPARPLSVSGTLPRREPPAWARWTVTEQLSAHHVLIVHVETRYLDEARSIARQIADPIRSRYAEILVYVHRPGRPDLVAPRRVQWTRQRGYVETKYE
jgi:hypothetical protein